MRVCIVGGGNIGTAMAVEFSSRGIQTNILTSKPELWSREISAGDLRGTLNLVTSDIERAIDSTDYIFVTLPSNVQKNFVDRLIPFASSDLKIVCVPGFGGAEFIFDPILGGGGHILGFQRVPMIARLVRYGREVNYSLKTSLELASFNGNPPDDLEALFQIPIRILPNYLCVTLTPSNPVLHTSRLYSMFRDFSKPLDSNIPFYSTWDDRSSKVMLALDDEVQAICRALPEIDLSSVKSLKDHYESHSIRAMTRKLSSIESFQNILSPMKQTPDGWIPDFSSRYFTCDFSFGLDILLQFAEILQTPREIMLEIMGWYRAASKNSSRQIDLAEYNIKSKRDILKFYGGKT